MLFSANSSLIITIFKLPKFLQYVIILFYHWFYNISSFCIWISLSDIHYIMASVYFSFFDYSHHFVHMYLISCFLIYFHFSLSRRFFRQLFRLFSLCLFFSAFESFISFHLLNVTFFFLPFAFILFICEIHHFNSFLSTASILIVHPIFR